MIRIEIEAIDAAHCRAQLQELLRMYPSDIEQKFRVEFAKQPDPVVMAGALDAAGEVVEVTQVSGTDGAALVCHDDPKPAAGVNHWPLKGSAPAPTPEAPQRRGRGRPKKSNSEAQPAVANNTGSGSAVESEAPAAGIVQAPVADIPLTSPDAAATVAATSATDASQPTAAQMRASLQALVESAPDTNTGQTKAREILAAFAARKVGEVKPENHAAIIAAATLAVAKFKDAAA